VRVNRLGDDALGEMGRQGQLHQDTLYLVVGVERLEGGAQPGVIHIAGQGNDAGVDANRHRRP